MKWGLLKRSCMLGMPAASHKRRPGKRKVFTGSQGAQPHTCSTGQQMERQDINTQAVRHMCLYDY